MAEGIEIIIDPKKLIPHIIYIVIIIILAVLLIIKWNSGSCDAEKKTADTSALAAAGAGQTNQTVNITNTTQAADACSNGVKDQDETDTDCGGSKCPKCAETKLCAKDSDCATGLFCYQVMCKKPSCTDAMKNQDETNVDCGGTCGGYWWASINDCRETEELSGKIDINVSVDASESKNTGYVILNSVTITLQNGLSRSLFLTASIYALTESGKAFFPDQEGVNIAIAEVSLDKINPGEKITKEVNLNSSSRKTLTGVSASDAYQILVELRDEEGNLEDKKTWSNNQ